MVSVLYLCVFLAMFLLESINMKNALYASALISLCIFSSCDPNPDTRYMYIQPESAVYDTAMGKAIDNSEVSISEMLVLIKTPYSQQTVFHPSALPFVTRSYATHKDMSRSYSVEKVTNMRVITLKDYDATHSAGSDVADICKFYTLKNNPDSNKANPLPGDTISVKKIVSEMNVSDANSSYGYYPGLRKDFVFRLASAPSGTSVQQFRVEFETATPSKFSTTTKQFTLKP